MRAFLINILFAYSKAANQVSVWVNQWYKESAVFGAICDFADYATKYGAYCLKKYIIRQSCEPLMPGSWYHTFTVNRDNQLWHSYTETYTPIIEDKVYVSFFDAQNRDVLKMVKYVSKETEYYLSFSKVREIDLSGISFSTAFFLAVEYNHPDMNYSIILDLPKSLFVVGNEILHPAFVYRYLQYQPRSFVFDKNYRIDIIDQDVKLRTVRYNESVLIDAESYRVVEEESRENLSVPPLRYSEPFSYMYRWIPILSTWFTVAISV